ncbi:protein of unknown function DUF418 [Beutenbergia cavernae DSM 12333]|uniref:DUF418 domain-containing protein n=1 Tax=Beutenbergia cavernae (strain ATCC BAA-8 / DSM 12333 / CCUG 43141 / JCM 11478 / NBRC 16432 / NCIMB 13614 / HKI 0122) TaxID=471853 RepID=C5C0F2_BEUC1|nr:DUF418 domain-containing protein [Beutenbergia cavernae]ACQ79338.1 protein of unknown function DUF418 [Beutenbergia cavernae DSM 12333]
MDSDTRRILAPDLARGFMLLLIALAHAPLYLSTAARGPDGRPTAVSAADQVVSVVEELFVHSRAYPLFAVLFGYGLVWSLERRRREGASDAVARSTVRRRGWWLLLFGLVMALVVTPVEILGAYGLVAVLVAGLLVRSDRALNRAIWILTPVMAALVVVGTVTFIAPTGAGASEPWSTLGYGLGELITRVVLWIVVVLSNVAFYPILLVVLIGAWAARRRILEDVPRHRALLRRTAVGGITVAVAGSLPQVLLGIGALPADAATWTLSLQVLTGVFGGLGYAAAFALFAHSVRSRTAEIRPLVATGRRSLTSYIVMEAALVVLMSSVFLGLGERTGVAGAAAVAVAAWAAAVASATLLDRAGRPGPADQLLRRLVRGRVRVAVR